METKPLVSIVCLTYNHENFIHSALDGFLMQKTSFPFEIIVHDDASTDGTANVIRQYAREFPEIIRPIYQTVNQTSQKISIRKKHVGPAIRGKYVALCEGDDYWIDEYKLQKQVDFLEKNPEYVSCYTANNVVAALSGEKLGINSKYRENGTIPVKDCVLGVDLPHLSTLVLRKELYADLPDFTLGLPVGDVVYLSFAGVKGKVYFMKDITSEYRCGVPGSWTVRNAGNLAMNQHHREKMLGYFEALDSYTDYKYHQYMEWKKDSYRFYSQRRARDFSAIFNNYAFKNGSLRMKVVWLIDTICPKILQGYRDWRYGKKG